MGDHLWPIYPLYLLKLTFYNVRFETVGSLVFPLSTKFVLATFVSSIYLFPSLSDRPCEGGRRRTVRFDSVWCFQRLDPSCKLFNVR